MVSSFFSCCLVRVFFGPLFDLNSTLHAPSGIRWAKAEQHLIDWGLPSLRRAVAVQWDYEGPSHRQRWPLVSVTFANQFWIYNRYLHISRVVPALFSVTGVSSPVELHSLGRMYGRPAVVQAASLPPPPPPPPPPLHAAGGSKGKTGVDTAWAPTASQELPEWRCVVKPPLGLQLLIFCRGLLP